MRIALDLDDTLFQLSIVSRVLREMKLNIKREDIRSWRMIEVPENAREEIFRRFKDSKYMCHLRPTKGTRAKLTKWANEGHKLICITSRYTGLTQETIAMVNRWYPMISEIYVVGNNKEDILKETKADLLIDDGTQNIKDAQRAGVRAVLIINEKTPYNWDRNFVGVPEAECISKINLKELFDDEEWHSLYNTSRAKHPVVRN